MRCMCPDVTLMRCWKFRRAEKGECSDPVVAFSLTKAEEDETLTTIVYCLSSA